MHCRLLPLTDKWVKSYRFTKGLGTVDLPQKADVSTNRRAHALGVSDVPLTFRRELDGQKSQQFQRGLSVLRQRPSKPALRTHPRERRPRPLRFSPATDEPPATLVTNSDEIALQHAP